MTTQEFKEKYPHLSHLEGNDLWNAMEDSLLYEQSKNPPDYSGKIFDREGIEVKDGDILEVWKIDTNKGNYFGMAIFDFSNNNSEIIKRSKKFYPNPDYGKDKLKGILKISKKGNTLYETYNVKVNGMKFSSTTPLKQSLSFWYPNCTIKIKDR